MLTPDDFILISYQP